MDLVRISQWSGAVKRFVTVAAALLGVVLGATGPCRSGEILTGVAIGAMGVLLVVSSRGPLPERAVMARAKMLAWRRMGPSFIAFGFALAVVGSIAYLIAGSGRCR